MEKNMTQQNSPMLELSKIRSFFIIVKPKYFSKFEILKGNLNQSYKLDMTKNTLHRSDRPTIVIFVTIFL